MVRDDPVGDIPFCLLTVRLTGHRGRGCQQRPEDIRVIVRLLVLNDHAETLESHPGVNVPVRQQFELTACTAVILYEHQVPYLNHKRVPLVDKEMTGGCCPLAFRPDVNMDLRTGSAGSGLTHLPEIILLRSVKNVVFETGKAFHPVRCGFVVTRHILHRITLEDGCIDSLCGNTETAGKKLPGPLYRLLLEVVAERPVAQHLEHCMMVGVKPHLLQVIVLARHPQAFLRVGHPPVFGRLVAEEYILELVHSGIRKHQCRIIFYHHGCRGHYSVFLRPEETEELFSYLVSLHFKLFAPVLKLFLIGCVKLKQIFHVYRNVILKWWLIHRSADAEKEKLRF